MKTTNKEKVLKTRFKEIDRFLTTGEIDYTTEIKNNEVIEFIVKEDFKFDELSKYVIENVVDPIVSKPKSVSKEKILYFSLRTSKECLKEIIDNYNVETVDNDNVEIIDNPKITIEEIRNKCEEVAKQGLSLVVIDYMQLVFALGDENSKKIFVEIGSIVHDLNIAIIVLYQNCDITYNEYLSSLELNENFGKLNYTQGFCIYVLNELNDKVLPLHIFQDMKYMF